MEPISNYKPEISRKKGAEGTVEGLVVSAVTLVVVGVVKSNIQLDPDAENLLAAGISAVVGGAVLGLSRMIRNWFKHK